MCGRSADGIVEGDPIPLASPDMSVSGPTYRRIAIALLFWADQAGRDFPWRRRHPDPYELAIAELLLQRTRAETVRPFYAAFISRFPNWDALATTSVEELRSVLQPIGLSRRRSQSFHALAAEMSTRRGRFPRSRQDLESLPGVGQYVASAIRLFVFGIPEPLLDSNMARVLQRVLGFSRTSDLRSDSKLQRIARRIILQADPIRLNWAFLDLGALACRAQRPRCTDCPLAGLCEYYRRQNRTPPLVNEIPTRGKKSAERSRICSRI
jgi:A/G-specific adenine glycosylase